MRRGIGASRARAVDPPQARARGGHSYRAYGGPDRPPGELSSLRALGVTSVTGAATRRVLDAATRDLGQPGMPGWTWVRLLPGRYDIAFSARSHKSTGAYHRGIVVLQAGRRHVVRDGSCYIGCVLHPLYTTFAWLADAESGEVIGGKQPPGHRPSATPR